MDPYFSRSRHHARTAVLLSQIFFVVFDNMSGEGTYKAKKLKKCAEY